MRVSLVIMRLYLTIRGITLVYAVFFIFLMTYLSSKKLVIILIIFFLSLQTRRCADPARNDLVYPFFIESILISFFCSTVKFFILSSLKNQKLKQTKLSYQLQNQPFLFLLIINYALNNILILILT